jgi:hypothetical protein
MRLCVLALCVLVSPRWVETSPLPDPAPWVPASANLVVYIDWSALSESPVLRGVESTLIESKSGAQIEKFRELTGMDPLHDVWAIAFFTTSDSTSDKDLGPKWGLACYGAFDPKQVIENLQAHGKRQRSEYRETALYSVPDFGLQLGSSSGDQVLAFPDGTTALLGPATQVRAMLDVGLGFASPASEAGELAGALKQLTAAETLWIVGRGDASLPGGVSGRSSGLSNVPPLASFSLSARVGPKVRVRARAETSDAEAADKLADLVRGIAAMGALQKQSDESLQALYESLEVETIDELVEIFLEIDADAVRKYFGPKVGEDRKSRAGGRKSASIHPL